MPKFSVIIPTRNRLPLLIEALTSVQAQTFPDFEVIVVNDGSTDGTAGYLSSLETPVKVITVACGSPGAARNAGAAVASGEYLAFLDSDDVWFPWTLATFAAVIEQHHPSLMSASFRAFATAAELRDQCDEALHVEVFRDYLETWRHPLIIGAGMIVVLRSVFEAHGGFETSPVNMEDHHLMLRLGTVPRFVCLKRPVAVGWRRHQDSVTSNLSKSLAGCRLLLSTEAAGGYPGGPSRATSRRALIATYVRSTSIECARARRMKDAARLYVATLGWHVSLRRWKYLAVFPFLLGASALRRHQA